jgi:hypothetical protein
MTIKWTDEACEALTKTYRASPYSFGDGTGYRRILAREMLDAATAVQFAPETDAEKVKRLEATMQEASTLIDRGGSHQAESARRLLVAALSYRKGA